MKTVTQEQLLELQGQPKCIRNICILAHVDHGKTTLADALVASNGIISNRLAGKLRYLDSLPEEQLRGITMKSSAISLLHKNDSKSYLINLIDSPGHIDFSSEVSTAVRLCDGTLIIVDVVEGVCPQTHAVLRQAWLEGIKPCLVLNKIDRLITELKQSPLEAFMHLQKVLEQVNAVTGTLFSTEILEKTSSQQAESKVVSDEQVFDWSSGLEEVDDSALYFSPDQGNVVFASAVDGWGFRVEDFAELYSKKIGIRPDVFIKTLWGDYYLHAKTKRIMKGAQAKAKKPLFVQFILNYIWEIYDAVGVRRDKERIEKIVQSLNLKISARDSRQNDSKAYLLAIFHQWLPLSKTVLEMVVEKLPSPLEISSERIEKLMCGGLRSFESLPDKTRELKQAFLKCRSEEGDPVIIFVSKMFAVDEQALPQNKRRPLTQEELAERREKARKKHSEMLSAIRKDEAEYVEISSEPDPANQKTTIDSQPEILESTEASEMCSEKVIPSEPPDQFIAFARVYSGVIKKGEKLFVLGPKHEPCTEDAVKDETDDAGEQMCSQSNMSVLSAAQSIDRRLSERQMASFTVKNLYLLMGRELESLTSVPAGNVLGIGGLENYVLKSATISSTLACPPFTALPYDVRPIVRVAVEPLHPGNMSALHRGMCLLNQADPIVEVLVQETGEHVLVGTGEVHIQRCIDDLKKRYANVELKVSDPIIPFRETIVPPPTVDMVNEVILNEGNVQTGKNINKENKEVTKGEISDFKHENDQTESQNIADVKTGLYRAQTGNKRCTIFIRACPLPDGITRLLDTSSSLLKDLHSLRKTGTGKIKESALEKLKEFYMKLKSAFEESGEKWKEAIGKIWAFGPRHVGPNILLNKISEYQRPSIWRDIVKSESQLLSDSSYREYDNSIINGFQLATSAGPLCEEPLMGVCFAIEDIIIDYGPQAEMDMNKQSGNPCLDGKGGTVILPKGEREEVYNREVLVDDKTTEEMLNDLVCVDSGRKGSIDLLSNEKDSGLLKPTDTAEKQQPEETAENPNHETDKCPSRQTLFGILSGQIISAVKDGCRQAFLLQPARLMAAMYTCNIQTPADVLGKMYGVISKREGKVLDEEMKEGSDVFIVNAVLPVAESFGFTEEIRKRTSGLARPLLQFTHWEVIDLDPYWVPTTEEEYLHFGVKADSENQARKYMNNVRRRKGLYVEAKTVEHAEKQRTLKK